MYYYDVIYDAVTRNYEHLVANEDGIYHGKEGCLRLAKEYGVGLADFKDRKKIKDDMQSSYSGLCVRAYLLRPPVDAKDWFEAVLKGLERGGVTNV